LEVQIVKSPERIRYKPWSLAISTSLLLALALALGGESESESESESTLRLVFCFTVPNSFFAGFLFEVTLDLETPFPGVPKQRE
jgi:hypothetical protein